MRQLTVRDAEAGQRLSNYLNRYLKEAPKGFLYKMLRKKNIVLNGKKADGGEKLAEGDQITLFLSEETITSFQGGGPAPSETQASRQKTSSGSSSGTVHRPLPVLYEDTDVIFFNKPAGMLSQKAKPEDYSVCEALTDYLLETSALTQEGLITFRPGVCNRLDRNTSGVIAAGKTTRGLQELSSLLRGRNLTKLYLCLVWGRMEKPMRFSGYLIKDARENKVTIQNTPPGERIETSCRPLAFGKDVTLLEVHLITGKTHQIRAQLACAGFPILGDGKYGDITKNRDFSAVLPLRVQLLHAWKICFPEDCGALSAMSGRCVEAPPPRVFLRCMKTLGIPEEALRAHQEQDRR